MDESKTRSFRDLLRTAVTYRAVTLLLAMVLCVIGLYPGPALVLLRDPVWRNELVVRHLTDERAFWITGALVIIGPAVVLANTLPTSFDRAWDSLRARLMSIDD